MNRAAVRYGFKLYRVKMRRNTLVERRRCTRCAGRLLRTEWRRECEACRELRKDYDKARYLRKCDDERQALLPMD